MLRADAPIACALPGAAATCNSRAARLQAAPANDAPPKTEQRRAGMADSRRGTGPVRGAVGDRLLLDARHVDVDHASGRCRGSW